MPITSTYNAAIAAQLTKHRHGADKAFIQSNTGLGIYGINHGCFANI
jgi:hypothetical protein